MTTPTSKDYNKTWIPGPSRGNQSFNAPGNLTIPYGRYKGTVVGRGGTGNVPNASAWATNYNTNYNVAYPIANRPIANQPITGYTTNYNTNYNVAYPIANQPVAFYFTFHYAASYNWTGQAHFQHGYLSFQGQDTQVTGPGTGDCPSPWSTGRYNPPPTGWAQEATFSCQLLQAGHVAYGANYNTNYNTAYPIANRPIANQPASSWATNYNTNYNTAYPIANQPIANRPITAYTPGNAGAAASVLGVTMPGGPVDLSQFGGSPGVATPISPTAVSYWAYPDNTTYPVTVPSGGQVQVTIE
jgi:hypothetical protein